MCAYGEGGREVKKRSRSWRRSRRKRNRSRAL
jgi:hypothetical protein